MPTHAVRWAVAYRVAVLRTSWYYYGKGRGSGVWWTSLAATVTTVVILAVLVLLLTKET